MKNYSDCLYNGDTLGRNAIVIMVLRVLRKMSDEEHALNATEIIKCIKAEYRLDLDRRTIYNTVETLQSLGYDIEKGKSGHGEGYYLASRQFEPEEILLLKSAVNGFPFISEKQSKDLIEKMQMECTDDFISKNDCLTIIGPEKKSLNKEFFTNVSFIRDAIKNKKMISFDYCDYGEDMKLYPKTETPLVVSPYAMSYYENHFYLICGMPKYINTSVFRMDLIKNVKPSSENIDRQPSSGELKASLKDASFACIGKVQTFTLKFKNDSLKYVIEQFGTNFMLVKDGDYLRATVHSTEQGMQYWALKYLNDIEVVQPEDFRQKLIDVLKDSTYLRDVFRNMVEKKKYSRDEIGVILQEYADCHNIPLSYFDDNVNLYSIKKLIMNGIDSINDFSQMIQVSDEHIQSFCMVEYKNDLNLSVLEKISQKLSNKYNCDFVYEDDGGRLLWSRVGVPYSLFDDAENEGFDDSLKEFFDSSIKFERIFYNAYVAVVEKKMTISNAIAYAEKEAEENGNIFDYKYKYNIAKEVVEQKGPRYFVEHLLFRNCFFNDPMGTVKLFTELDTEVYPTFAADLFKKFLDDYDLPYVPDYNETSFKVMLDTPEKKIVQISIPHGRIEFNCSDIILVVSDKEIMYYTVELGIYSNPNCILNDFFLCAWDKNQTHNYFGHFPVRDKAIKEFNRRMKEN